MYLSVIMNIETEPDVSAHLFINSYTFNLKASQGYVCVFCISKDVL